MLQNSLMLLDGLQKRTKYFSLCWDIFKIKMIPMVSYVSPEAKSQALNYPKIMGC